MTLLDELNVYSKSINTVSQLYVNDNDVDRL